MMIRTKQKEHISKSHPKMQKDNHEHIFLDIEIRMQYINGFM